MTDPIPLIAEAAAYTRARDAGASPEELGQTRSQTQSGLDRAGVAIDCSGRKRRARRGRMTETMRSTFQTDGLSLDVVLSKIDGRWSVTSLTAVGDVNAQTLRSIPIGRITAQAEAAGATSDALPPISRPNGKDTDTFYRQIADAYLQISRETRRIAPVIAADSGAPVGTVHRWIREARSRGFLPPHASGVHR